MRNLLISALTGLWLVSGVAFAQELDDLAEILALMDKVFAAVASGNPDDWRAIQLAEGTTL